MIKTQLKCSYFALNHWDGAPYALWWFSLFSSPPLSNKCSWIPVIIFTCFSRWRQWSPCSLVRCSSFASSQCGRPVQLALHCVCVPLRIHHGHTLVGSRSWDDGASVLGGRTTVLVGDVLSELLTFLPAQKLFPPFLFCILFFSRGWRHQFWGLTAFTPPSRAIWPIRVTSQAYGLVYLHIRWG